MVSYQKRKLCNLYHIFPGLLGSTSFSGSSQNFSTLLLEEDAGLLYVGGRGALYALNTSNIATTANLSVSATKTSTLIATKKKTHFTSFLPFPTC